jgi:hypothetical protein
VRDSHPLFGNTALMTGACDSPGGLVSAIAVKPGARADTVLFDCANAHGIPMIAAEKTAMTAAAAAAATCFMDFPLFDAEI